MSNEKNNNKNNEQKLPNPENNVYNHETEDFMEAVGLTSERMEEVCEEYNDVLNDRDLHKKSQKIEKLIEVSTPKEMAVMMLNIVHQQKRDEMMNDLMEHLFNARRADA